MGLTALRRGVRGMSGIPAKCHDCGQILMYDGANAIYYCPECEPRKPEPAKVEEVKKAA